MLCDKLEEILLLWFSLSFLPFPLCAGLSLLSFLKVLNQRRIVNWNIHVGEGGAGAVDVLRPLLCLWARFITPHLRNTFLFVNQKGASAY